MEQRIVEWTHIFLKYIRERSLELHVVEDEGYKFQAVQTFQTHFDIEATDLVGMLDVSLENNNLVGGAMYFPKKMLLIYAQVFPEETRGILRRLFGQTEEVAVRIDYAKRAFEDLERRREHPAKRAFNTYIGLRFLSLLLSFYDPNAYNPLKPAEWKVFCRFVDPGFAMPNRTQPGEQYNIYNRYIDQLRVYLKTRPEFAEIRGALTKGLSFTDDEYRWLAQDVIFVTARVYANSRSTQPQAAVSAENPAEDSSDLTTPDEYNTGFMPLEKHLEEYVIKNWDNIHFGETLRMYVDEDGTTGQQYTTDVGIIDILALDKHDNFVVIELKRAEYGSSVVGQTLNYMGWVGEKLAKDGQQVRGLIVVGRADKTLRSAVKPVADKIAVKEYRVQMQLQDPA